MCEIWPKFLTPVTFDALWLINGATYQKSNTFTLSHLSPKFYRKIKYLG